MKKRVFLQKLKRKLSGLPRREIDERLGFYSEMIDDKIEDGLTEEKAVAQVSAGVLDSDELAEEGAFAYLNERLPKKRKMSATVVALLIIGSPIWLSLLIAAFAVAISLYAVLWSVTASLWAGFASLLASGVGAIIYGTSLAFMNSVPSGVAIISAALVCCGLAILFFFACKNVTICTLRFTKLTPKLIKKLFRRREAT